MDWILLWAVMFVAVGAVVMRALGNQALDAQSLEEMLPRLQRSQSVATAGVLASALPGVYFTLAEGLAATTLGKRAVGLTVVGLGGEPAELPAAFRRNAWNFAFLIPGVLLGLPLGPTAMIVLATGIALSIVNDDRRRGWHDRIAETVIVRDRD